MATRTISTKLAIDGEGEYRAALSRVNTELKSLQSSLKLTESQFQTNANSMEALKAKHEALTNLYDAQKTKVDTLRAALENAKSAHDNFAQKSEELKAKIQANNEALEKLRATTGDTTAEEQKLIKENEALNAELAKNEQYAAAAEKGVNSWQTQLNKAQIDLNNLDAELKQNDALLDEAKSSSDGCAHSIDEFGNKVKSSGEATEKQNEALEALAAALAAAGIVAGIEKIKDALKACVAASTEFEAGMSAVGAIANASSEEMDLLSDKAKQIGASTMYTAGQAAEALQYMALAGWSAEEMLQGVDGVINLAAASGENLATVSDIVTDALTAFGLKAEDSGHFVDVLAKTAASSNTTVTMLGEAFQYAAPLAGAMGYSVEDVAVAMGLMANQGIKGSQAGTAMRTMFTKLAGDITLTADAFGEVTISSANADGSMKPLSESLDILRFYFNQMTEAEKLANAEAVAGKYAMSGLTAIMNSTQSDFDSLTRTISDCTGAASKMADIRMDNLQGQVTLMESAFDALKISVGDDLNPALRGLTEVGTDALTWAGNFIEKHESIVPVIAAVTAGLTTFTGSVAAFTAGAKLIIPLIETFNATLAANPIALVITAVVTLTAVLATLAATMPDTEDEYRSLTSASKDQYDHLQELNAQYERACELYGENSEEARKLAAEIEFETDLFEKNKTTIEDLCSKTDDLITKNRDLRQAHEDAARASDAQEASDGFLVERLQELIVEEEKSAGTKQQILAVVEALNNQVPSLGLAYDEYADKLNMTTENLIALAQAEADRQRAAEGFERQVELEKLQSENKAQLIDIETELSAVEERLVTARENQAIALENYNELVPDTLDAYVQATDEVAELDSRVSELTGRQQALTDEYNKNAEEIVALAEAQGELIQSQAELEGSTDDLTRAEKTAAEAISGKLSELADAYKESYDSALKSLDGQFGLWESAPEVVEKSVNDMLAAQQSQLDWWENYSNNLDALLDRNVEGVDRLAANFADGSAESAAALQGLAGATDEEIARIISTMDQVSESRDTLAGNFAALNTNLTGAISGFADQYEAEVQRITGTTENVDFGPFLKAVETAFSEAGAKLTTVGEDAAKGLSSGIETGSGEVLIAADTLGKGVIDALKTALDSHSPSRETEKIGEDADEGLAKGVSGHSDLVLNAADDLGSRLRERMGNAGLSAVEGFDSEYKNLRERIRWAMEEARMVVSDYGWTLEGEMQSVGTQMVDGMISGIYGNSGSLYSAMAEVTREAIEAARQAADTHSPSKKTAKIFEDVGEGMVVGIEAKKQKVRTATADVVNSALWISPDSIRELSRSINASIPDFGSLLGSRNERNGEVASGGSAKVGKSNNYHIEMNITTQPGQNNEEIAEYVMDKMQRELERKGGAF